MKVSSKIDEIGEIFQVRSEAITVEVSKTSVPSGIKVRKVFIMRYSFQ